MLISKYGNGSVELVSEFERRYGIELDEEYRGFLVKYNGRATPEEREAAMIAEGRAHVVTDGLRAMWKAEYDKYKDMVQEKVIL